MSKDAQATKVDRNLFASVKLVGGTTVNGLLYGIALGLYCLCALSLFQELKCPGHRRHHIFTLIHLSLVMSCGLFVLAAMNWEVRVAFIDYAHYMKGGSLGYNLLFVSHLPIDVAIGGVRMVLYVLLLGIMIWRLWVIWNTSRYVTVVMTLPVLSLLAFLGFEIFTFVPTSHKSNDSLAPVRVFTSMVLGLATVVITGFLIVWRIVSFRRRHAKTLGQHALGSHYISIIAILVESFSLVAVWLSCELATNDRDYIWENSSSNLFLSQSEPFIIIIAYFLFMYRIIAKRAWTRDTERQLTTLQWNRSQQQTIDTESAFVIEIPPAHRRAG
ncbi:hypothetical protein AN958_10788 [Leucoagaricus sp. SymC.cos]|nr:hypothetical protein AN958_10788 [Leucoagaricus sp. SymC.cos]